MEENGNKRVSDHLANERTFLAWLRTGIGIMAFGFVVVKFSLFVKQLTLLLGKDKIIEQKGYSALLGILLVAAGLLMTLLAYARFKRTQKQIDENSFRSSSYLLSFVVGFVTLISLLLIVYLIENT